MASTPTTTPFPGQRDKSAQPPVNISLPMTKNERRVIPVTIGPIALASGAGNLVTGLDLKKFAPRGGRIIDYDVLITLAGAGAGADASVNLELDTVNLTGGVRQILLAQAVLGAVLPPSAITALNTFTSATGILDIEYAVATVFTAGSMQIVLYIEVTEDTTIQTGVIARQLVTRPGRLAAWYGRIGAPGSAGSTVIRARKNGTPITDATSTIAFGASAANFVIPCNVDVDAGDVIDLEVTTAPTAGAQIDAAAVVHQLF